MRSCAPIGRKSKADAEAVFPKKTAERERFLKGFQDSRTTHLKLFGLNESV